MKSKSQAKGSIFVISSPSGGGKTTLGHQLLKTTAKLRRSISMTTREKRKGERNRRDYFFVSAGEFLKIKKRNGFLESAKVFDHYYGTPKAFVKSQQQKGIDILMLIDVQGAKQVRKQDSKAVLIFIMPPSMRELSKRLKKRSTDSKTEIAKRLKIASKEIKESKKYDYIVVNKSVAKATKDLKKIIQLERLAKS